MLVKKEMNVNKKKSQTHSITLKDFPIQKTESQVLCAGIAQMPFKWQ